MKKMSPEMGIRREATKPKVMSLFLKLVLIKAEGSIKTPIRALMLGPIPLKFSEKFHQTEEYE